MIQSGPSGFGRAPISKALVFTAVVMTMTTSLLKSKGEFFALSYTKVFSKLGLWRFFTCHLGYSSPPELLFGAALLYCFRTFERQFGSKKYAHCVVGISTLSTVFQTILMLIFPKLNFAPGPYAVMFGMFAYYFMDIPSVTRFRVCGIPMNDKIFLYLLGIQGMLFDIPESLTPALCGLVSGFIYRADILPFLKSIRAPDFITQLCEKMFSSGRRGERRGYARVGQEPDTMDDDRHSNHGGSGDILLPEIRSRNGAGAAAISQENVDALVAMGFDEGQARSALQITSNNLEAATHRLLG